MNTFKLSGKAKSENTFFIKKIKEKNKSTVRLWGLNLRRLSLIKRDIMELVKKSRNPKSILKQRNEKVLDRERAVNHDFVKLVEEQLLISFLYEISGSPAIPLKR